MEHPTMLRIGDWSVDPSSGRISRNGVTARVEERTMRLLLCLANRAGQVVSIDDLLNQVWSEVAVSPDSVYQAVASLRRLLGDDPKQPRYIATVPRLGYRMVATVSPWTDNPEKTESPVIAGSPQKTDQSDPSGETITAPLAGPGFGLRRKPGFTGSAFKWIGGATLFVILLALSVILAVHGNTANNNPSVNPIPQKTVESIAVLPFLDLTEGMKEETFADGMTEELIDKLSKIPGLRVPAPTSSFYFKGKQIPVAEIARSLGVAYILDGSVRKSGPRLRVAARLMRADNGYIIWSETYDRPFSDILMVQDDIAGEVTNALSASIKTDQPTQAIPK